MGTKQPKITLESPKKSIILIEFLKVYLAEFLRFSNYGFRLLCAYFLLFLDCSKAVGKKWNFFSEKKSLFTKYKRSQEKNRHLIINKSTDDLKEIRSILNSETSIPTAVF